MSDLSKAAPDHDERQAKAAVAEGMQTPSQPSNPRPRGAPAPHAELRRERVSSAKLLRGWAEGGVALPFHRKPNLVPGGFKHHRDRAVVPFFPLTASPWDII